MMLIARTTIFVNAGGERKYLYGFLMVLLEAAYYWFLHQ